MFHNPLEQFEIYALFSFIFGNLDFSITNASLILVFGLLCLIISFQLLTKSQKQKTYLFSTNLSCLIDLIYTTLSSLIEDNVGKKGQHYFPFIFTLFLFILGSNLIGLVPYSFTTTSHLIVTFGFAFIIFLGVNLICLQQHGSNILTLFLPSGTSLGLAFLLIPIELVSYLFKPVSLGVRLFANMMAGHTLLKVIAGFAWTMMMAGGFLFLAHWIPLFVLILLIGLELSVAIIQAYVFTILTCIYLNDAINLH
jgi:ATP synthase subunit 6